MEENNVKPHHGDKARIIVLCVFLALASFTLIFAYSIGIPIFAAPSSAVTSSSDSNASSSMEIAGQIGGAIAVGWAIVLAVLLVLFLVGLVLADAIIGTIASFRHMKRSERPYRVWYLVLGILHSILIAASVTLLIILFIPHT